MKVLVFGTYDILHKGHLFFLKKAKSFGKELFVVVALDETVLKLKKRLPKNNELKRVENIKKLNFVDDAILGNKDDKYKVIEELNPNVIVLGYDQFSFTSGLEVELENRGLIVKIIRINESLNPKKYKSSILRND